MAGDMSGAEHFGIATRLFARLRRNGGRPIDVQWMLRDEKYAREVIEFARSTGDATVIELADRYEALLPGKPRPKTTAPAPAPTVSLTRGAPPVSMPSAPEAAPSPAEEEKLIAARYRGGLR